jgi:hypothetical protein
MGKRIFIYLAALASALLVFASPVGLHLVGADGPAVVRSASQSGGGGGP